MRQFILPLSYNGSDTVPVSGEDFHYVTRILRLQEGDTFRGIDHQGNIYTLTLTKKEREQCTLSITPKETERDEEYSGFPHITLFQCLPKGKKMDLIVRQAVEAGVTALYPVESENTIPKVQSEKSITKKERWDRIVEEAVQQSGSPIITRIHDSIPLREIPCTWGGISCTTGKAAGFSSESHAEKRCGLFFHEKQLEKKSLHDYLSDSLNEIGIVIGPEGGLSPEEVDLLIRSGFNPVYLGKNVLRTETAALYAVAAVTTTYMERSSWKLRR